MNPEFTVNSYLVPVLRASNLRRSSRSGEKRVGGLVLYVSADMERCYRRREAQSDREVSAYSTGRIGNRFACWSSSSLALGEYGIQIADQEGIVGWKIHIDLNVSRPFWWSDYGGFHFRFGISGLMPLGEGRGQSTVATLAYATW